MGLSTRAGLNNQRIPWQITMCEACNQGQEYLVTAVYATVKRSQIGVFEVAGNKEGSEEGSPGARFDASGRTSN